MMLKVGRCILDKIKPPRRVGPGRQCYDSNCKNGVGLQAHAARGAKGGEDRRGDGCDELCNKLNRFFLTHNFEILNFKI